MTAALRYTFATRLRTESPGRAFDAMLHTRYLRVEHIRQTRVAKAPLNVPLQSTIVPGWNSQGRLATDTLAEKRMRLSQGLPLKTNLVSEFDATSKRGGRWRRPCVNSLHLPCLHVSCPQSYSQALKSPEVSAWKEYIAGELHVLFIQPIVTVSSMEDEYLACFSMSRISCGSS